MAFVIDTTDWRGLPWCPICNEPVEEEGDFCSPTCFDEFHMLVFDLDEVIEMPYKGLYQQPWYSKEGL